MRKSTVLATGLLCCLLSVSGSAQDFWAHRFVVQTDMAYGEHALQKLDAYIQGQRVGEPDYFVPAADPRPTLMWIHGGGWVAGDKAREVSNLIAYLEAGWNVYNVNYRQGADTAPQAVDDVLCAYKYITERVARSGQNPNEIVVSGASAGGHLALVVGLINSGAETQHACKTEVRPKAVVNWFGITDIALVDEFLAETRPDNNYARTWAADKAGVEAVSDAYSPIYLVSDEAPPIISVHGTDDTVVPYDQGESFHSTLNTTHELVTISGGNHSGFTDQQYKDALTRIFNFLSTL